MIHLQFAHGTSIVSFLMQINACSTLFNVKHVRYRIDNDSFAIREGTSIVSFLMKINTCLTLFNVKHESYCIDNDSFAIRGWNINSYVSDADQRLFSALERKTRK